MKKYLFTFILILISNTSFASKAFITVENLSASTITVVREDGTIINIAPFDKLYNVPFRTRSNVFNYVDGKLVCQWYIHSKLSEITHDLIYNPEYGRRSGNSPCTKIVTRIF